MAPEGWNVQQQPVAVVFNSWPAWEREVRTFTCTDDKQEACPLLEGDVNVTPDG